MDDNTHLVDGKYGIRDLVDLVELRRIFELFTEATGFTIGFLDHPGLNILIASGWLDICTKHHRNCPVSAENCVKSNRHLLDNLDEPGKLVIEQCENGLVDCAFPIIVKGKHIASLATGQLLLEKPDLERFRRQARLFGIDEAEYMSALSEVPLVSEAKLRSVTTFLGEIAVVLSEVGYARLTTKEDTKRLEAEINVRKQAEASHERLAMAVEQAGETIVITDSEARILYVNPAFERITGYARVEALGKNPRILQSGKHDAEFYRNMWAILTSGSMWAGHFTNKKKDGTLYEEDATISPIRNAAGTITNYVAVKRDVTHEIQLGNQLRQAQKMESIGRLAGGVAHDFNNLLTVVLGYTEVCCEQVGPDHSIQPLLAEITHAAERSAEITRQLLAFARKQDIAPRVLDLNEAVAGMLKLLQRLIGEDITLAWLPCPNPFKVKIDPSQVDQILANLCINARDAIKGVGRITLATRNIALEQMDPADRVGSMAGDYVLLTVSDNGCGIDKETLTHIFEPFFTTKDIGKGTGLGLATVYGAVKQNNGYVFAASEPGEGTTFKIYLPKAAGEASKTKVVRKQQAPQGGVETILLVEDEESVRSTCKLFLETLGYKMLIANSPAQALAMAGKYSEPIHLLLTDVVMPGMDGLHLSKEIGATRPGIKILLMSGYSSSAITKLGAQARKLPLITKPFTRVDLSDKVRELLDKK